MTDVLRSRCADLNARFGKKPFISFVIHHDQFIFAEIKNDFAQSLVSLYGAQVLSFQPQGEPDILWKSRHSHYERGKAIRGGIPVCWPWFGAHPTDKSKPSHGFARLNDWSVMEVAIRPDSSVALTLSLEPSDAIKALWPFPFSAELRVAVGPKLGVTLAMTNRHGAALDFTCALHSYFNISSADAVRLEGLDSATYLDLVLNEAAQVQRGPLVIDREIDREYDSTAPVSLVDPGLGRVITVEKTGSQTSVIWNPWKDRAGQMKDFGGDEYRCMVCVEAANCAPHGIRLDPGQTHALGTVIFSSRT